MSFRAIISLFPISVNSMQIVISLFYFCKSGRGTALALFLTEYTRKLGKMKTTRQISRHLYIIPFQEYLIRLFRIPRKKNKYTF